MRRAASWRWLLAACLALLGAGGNLDTDVRIATPELGQPVFGEAELRADITASQPIERVVFRVDGREIAVLRQPPWSTRHDFGGANVEHLLEVLVEHPDGEVARAVMTTARIAVEEEIDLDLQQLYVTVERGGRRVLDLRQEDFAVADDGVGQRIVTFERGDVPLTAALLLDASASMEGEPLRLALAGARAFVEGMAPLDEARLTLFSDQPLYDTPFGHDVEALLAPLAGATARGGTALDDSLYVALRRLEQRQGRRVVVLLSDGVDVESVLGIDDVRWLARRGQTLVYWILPRKAAAPHVERSSPWRDQAGHRREQNGLADLVEESGGRVIEVPSAAAVGDAFAEILRELRDQYVIGYYPAGRRHDGSWHQVEVRVRGLGHKVRARGGYRDE